MSSDAALVEDRSSLVRVGTFPLLAYLSSYLISLSRLHDE